MSWQVVRLQDVAATPWRNGGGVTRELAAWPPSGDWSWRMSVAEVDRSGPFSVFEGVERWFAVLEGAGVELDVSGSQHRLTALDAPFFFDGAENTVCTLIDGRTQDFNLMVKQGAAPASASPASRMRRAIPGFSTSLPATETIAVYALSTGASGTFNGELFTLPPASLAWRHIPETASLTIDAGSALVMEIKP